MEKNNFIKLSLEFWQMTQLVKLMAYEIPSESAKPKMARFNYSLRQFERLLVAEGISLISYDHQRYEPNLPVVIVNKDDITSSDELIITLTQQPTILKEGQVIEMGRVYVKPIK